MAPPVGPVYQMTYQMKLDGQTCENVLHFRTLTGTETDTQIGQSAELYLATVKPLIHQNVTFPLIVIKQMTPLAFDEKFWVPVNNTQGAVGGEIRSNSVAIILTKRTGIAGKTHRGRIYLPGVPFNLTTPNGLNVGGGAVAQTVCGNLIATFGDAGTDLNLRIGVYSRSIGGFNPFTPAGWQQITRFDPQPVLGNQRRRRPGVGI